MLSQPHESPATSVSLYVVLSVKTINVIIIMCTSIIIIISSSSSSCSMINSIMMKVLAVVLKY